MSLILYFFWRIRNGRIEPLAEPRNVSNTTMIVSGALSIGVSMSFCYTMVHDLVFKDCDAIIEVDSSDNWAIGQYEVFNFLMLLFTGILAYYLRQRMYFPSDFDWVDFVTIKITSSLLVVLWIDELIYKSHGAIDALFPINGEIASRNNVTFISPCMKEKHAVKCHPEQEFKDNESKLYWYRLDEYLIHQVVASLACEYYPVLLVIHWVVTGRANNEVERIIQRQEQSKSIDLPLRRAAACISRVPELEFIEVPHMTIQVSFLAKFLFNCLAIFTVLTALAYVMVGFYYTIDSANNGYHAFGILYYSYSLSSILLFVLIIAYLRNTGKQFLDSHYVGEAKADMRLLLGSAIFMTMGSLYKSGDLLIQLHKYDQVTATDILGILHPISIHLQCWLQYYILKKVAGFGKRALIRHLNHLPCVILAAVFINFVNFWSTFLQAWRLHYLSHYISTSTNVNSKYLIASTFVRLLLWQVVIPLDLLFYFTSCSMWSEIAVRYSKLGAYRLEKVKLDYCKSQELSM